MESCSKNICRVSGITKSYCINFRARIMTKIYRYIFNTNQDDPKREIREYLVCHKIKYSEGLLLIFEIPESRADFIEVKEFLDTKAGKIIQVRLDYSKKELNAAAYLQLWLRKYSGYPQPETIDVKKSYINYTYDITNFCTNCGSGLIQNDSFYIKKSFNIEKIRFGGLYWVYDTFFITNELCNLLVKEGFTGIEFLPVKNIKTKQPIDNIVQLKINTVFPTKLKYEVKKVIECKVCNQKKDLIKDGSEITVSKEILKHLDKDFYLSQEFTGDGLLCCRRVLISNRVYKFFNDNKIKNICVEPIRFE